MVERSKSCLGSWHGIHQDTEGETRLSAQRRDRVMRRRVEQIECISMRHLHLTNIRQASTVSSSCLSHTLTHTLSLSSPSPSLFYAVVSLPNTSFALTFTMMKTVISVLALAIASSATPIALPNSGSAVVAARQIFFDRTDLTENEFSSRLGGGCRDVIFVWARGSTEAGNMVSYLRVE